MRAPIVISLLLGACGFRADGDVPDAAAVDAAVDPPLVPTYFVDHDGGSDGLDGRTRATAWKHAPGDPVATLVPLDATLVPGDVVLFKGGVVYPGQLSIPASGADGKPIVFTGYDEGTWGAGRAIIEGEELRRSGITVRTRAYVRIDGFELAHFDKTMNPIAIEIDRADHAVVSRNRIHDVYFPINPGGTGPWAGPVGIGVSVQDSSFASITDNTIRDVGYAGVAWRASAGTMMEGLIARNDIANMNQGVHVETLGAAAAGTRIVGLVIEGNYIHDFDRYVSLPTWNQIGIDVDAEATGDQGRIEQLEIARNYFEASAPGGGSEGWIYVNNYCTGFRIHHNVMHRSPYFFAMRFYSPMAIIANHVIASNTIANHNNGGGVGLHVDGSAGMQIVNNIFYTHHEAYEIATSSMSGFTANYNLFFRLSGAPSETIVARLNAGPANNPAGDLVDLAGLRQAGFEANGVSADPVFSTPFDAIDASAAGFAPAVGSPAVGAGTTTPWTKDFAGTAIPVGGTPDIGAFEAH